MKMNIKLTVAVGLTLSLIPYSESKEADCHCNVKSGYFEVNCNDRAKLRETRECKQLKLTEFRVILGSSWKNLDASDVEQIARIGNLLHSQDSTVTVLSITCAVNVTIGKNSFAPLQNSDIKEFVLRGFNIAYLYAYNLALLPPGLEAITITQSYIRDIGEDVFKEFKKLRSIDLSYNKIDRLPSYFYTDVNHGMLETLNLEGNLISKIDFKDFFQLDFTQLELDLSNNYLIVQDTINKLVQNTNESQHIKLKILNSCFCCNNNGKSEVAPRVQLIEYDWQPCKTLSECAAGREQGGSSTSEYNYCYFVTEMISDLDWFVAISSIVCGALLLTIILGLIVIVLKNSRSDENSSSNSDRASLISRDGNPPAQYNSIN